MQRRVSVVIPVRNDAAALPDAVRSVLEQESATVDEILVVVAPSSDQSEHVAQRLATTHHQVRVLENPSGRTPDALNRGITEAEGDVIVRVDARSVLPLDYLANALETLEATGAGNVGAIQVPVGDDQTQRAIAAAMSSRLGSGGAAYRHPRELSQVDTAYLGAFRRDALAEVGGFDATFVRNQDAELNARLNKAGHLVWLDPRLRVEYRPRSSIRALASQYWQYGWWRLRSIRKNRLVAMRQLVVPVAVVAIVVSLIAVGIGLTWAAIVPLVYLIMVVGAAIMSAGLSLRERGTMMVALVAMHFSWSAGFIFSAFQTLLGRGPSRSAS